MELIVVLLTSLLVTTACTTTPTTSSDIAALDIKPERERKRPTSETLAVKSESVFNWQQFFKAPPSIKDRSELLKSVERLKSSGQPADLIKRARNEVALGQYSAAEAAYREVLRGDRKNLDAMTELAALYYRVKKSESCLSVLSDIKDTLASQEKPNKLSIFRYRYVLALSLIQSGDRDRGHEILSDLIGQEKAFVPGYAALASSYLAVGKDQVAKFIVERGLDRGNDDPTLYNILGVIAERQGRSAQAREHYNKSISLNDGFAPALVNRANLYVASKQWGLAEGDLKRALEYDPMNVDAMISFGIVLRQTGRTEQAKNVTSRVLEISPDSAEARYNLALIMRDNMKDNTEALRLFNEVLQTEKANTEIKALAKAAVDELKTY